MDLLSSTKNFIFMLIESPSIYWFLLAFYYFHATEEALFPSPSFLFNRCLFKLLTVYSCLFFSLRRTRVNPRPFHGVLFFWTARAGCVWPWGYVEGHGAMLLWRCLRIMMMVLVWARCLQREKWLGLHQQSVSLTDGNTWSSLTALLTAHSREVPSCIHCIQCLLVCVFRCFSAVKSTLSHCQCQSQLLLSIHMLKIARPLHRVSVGHQRESEFVEIFSESFFPVTGHLSALFIFLKFISPLVNKPQFILPSINLLRSQPC